MAFTTFESTRAWAKAIKAAVLNRKMPPWFADPHVGGELTFLQDAELVWLMA